MKRLFFSTIILIQFIIIGCASDGPHRERPKPGGFDPELCNEQAGYELGLQDGKKNLVMNSSFASRCREDLKALAVKGYTAGYKEGQVEYKEELKVFKEMQEDKVVNAEPKVVMPQTQPVNSKTININIGGNQTVGGSPTQNNTPNPKAFYCVATNAFGRSFEAFAPTKLEAQLTAKKACADDTNEMHCKKVECSENQ